MFQDVVLTYTVGWAEEIRIDFCFYVSPIVLMFI